MFHPDTYIASLINLLQPVFGERLIYVGLQGSYLRGEATETSDIDIMAVIRDMTVADLIDNGHKVHSDTEKAREYIKEKLKENDYGRKESI